MTTVLWVILAVALTFTLATVLLRLRPAARAVDLRANGRIPLSVPVRVRIGDHVLEAMSSDLGRGGICLQASITGSAGQPIELEFALPGYAKMVVYGVVRWRRPESFGVLFDVRHEHSHVISDWMDAQLPETAEA
jgi:hypothetical protein